MARVGSQRHSKKKKLCHKVFFSLHPCYFFSVIWLLIICNTPIPFHRLCLVPVSHYHSAICHIVSRSLIAHMHTAVSHEGLLWRIIVCVPLSYTSGLNIPT